MFYIGYLQLRHNTQALFIALDIKLVFAFLKNSEIKTGNRWIVDWPPNEIKTD